MFGLGGTEIFLIAVLALLLFGPDKLPQLARTVGRFVREFNKYKDTMESTIRAEVYRTDWDAPTKEGTPTVPESAETPIAAPAPDAAWASDEDDEEDEEE